MRPARYKGAHGGRGSGKSHLFAEMMIEAHVMDPNRSSVCVREVQRTLSQSVKRLLEDKIKALGVGDFFEVQESVIKSRRGSGRIIFIGMQDHTADSVKSLEGYDCAWVEEAQSLSEKSMRLLRPTIRKPGSELWFTWNPVHHDDAVDVLLRGKKRPEDSVIVEVNWSDNPWFPEVLRKEMEHDRINNPENFGHVWGGEYFSGGGGRVYSRFDRRINTIPVVRQGTIQIACDFNVRYMHWLIAEVDEQERKAHIVGEVIKEGGTTTDEHAERVADWLVEYLQRTRGRQTTRDDVFRRRISAYIDATGQSLRTTSSFSDFVLLTKAGFRPICGSKNPPVKDRVNTLNVLFRDRRVSVDSDACPILVRGLETQALDKNGEPEKKDDNLDHGLDALGYLAWQWPVYRKAGEERTIVTTADEWGFVA